MPRSSSRPYSHGYDHGSTQLPRWGDGDGWRTELLDSTLQRANPTGQTQRPVIKETRRPISDPDIL